MRKWMTSLMAVAVCGACFVAGQVSAQEDGGASFPIPEWAQMGPEHAELAKWVGEWDVKQEMWMAPEAPPMETAATTTYTSVFGGRFIESTFAGDMMGTPFTGRLLMGFDRVDKEYVAVWIDSLSSYMSVSRGPMKDGKVTLHTNDPDWMTGEKTKGRMELTWTDKNTAVLTFIGSGPDGKDATHMRMTYLRKTDADDSDDEDDADDEDDDDSDDDE